jgi:predicted DCC family thiol-disulfide oxidoreductase YuxK
MERASLADATSDAAPDPGHAIVIFDGLCNFCDWSVQFMLAHDRSGYFRFASSQSAVAASLLARHGLPDAPGTIVLIDREGAWTRSTATLRIARRLGLPWSLASVLLWLPAGMRDPIYRLVARNRVRWFGRRDTCRLPAPGERERFLG